MGKIYYLMGKSAVGKDHFYHELKERLHLKPLVLYTTRPIRDGEEDGREYYFVNEARLSVFRMAGKVIEERCYETVHGPWYYFTADDGQIRPGGADYLAIGTLESYAKLKDYFGGRQMVPLYIETEDGLRLERALQRERKQKTPSFAELCRRFLADTEDFSEENLARAGITKRYQNNGTCEECLEALLEAFENK